MNRGVAEAFLREHQPFEASDQVPPEVIKRFDEVRQYLLADPHPVLVELLLGVYGPGDLFGRYPLIEDVVRASQADLVPRVAALLASKESSVRYWNAQIAGTIGDERLIPALAALLKDADFDTRYAAISSLEAIGGPTAMRYLSDALSSEREPELVDLLRDVLNE